MTTMLRRFGHIVEHAPNNIAGALRQAPAMAGFVGMAQVAPQSDDPWQIEGGDPWAAGAATMLSTPSQPSQSPPAAAAAQAAAPQESYPAVEHAEAYDSGTDTDTSSAMSNTPLNYQANEYRGLSPWQIDAKLFWEMKKAKRTWRRHMNKPTRKVRRFLNNNDGYFKGKGKGNGKGGRRFAFLETMNDSTIDEVFYGGKMEKPWQRKA